MLHLVLVRHAHTAGNDAGDAAPMSGWTDLPLSARGLEQVASLADHLRRRAARFDALYASPLRRAMATARAFDGLAAPPRVDPDLREIGCGEADGLPLRDVRRRFADAWAANLRQDDDGFAWPGGESYRGFRARVLAALGRIAAAHPVGRVAVVTHAGVIAQLVGWLDGLPAARWDVNRPRNASLTELALDAGRWRLVSFDQHAHLAAARAA